MAANNVPIFTGLPKIGGNVWLPATTANTKSDGTGTIGTDMLLVFSPGSNGSFINKIRLCPVASAASTATTATCARLYLSTQSTGATTNANTRLFSEQALISQTADAPTGATNYVEIPCGFYIPSTQFILLSMHHAAAANTAWQAIVFGGDY